MKQYINECKEIFKILNSIWKGDENAYFKNPKIKYFAQLSVIILSIMFGIELANHVECSNILHIIIILALITFFQLIFSIILSMIIAVFINKE